jgi:hypothetical protein
MFEVMKEKCNECLYSPNRVVSIARRKEILRDCKQRNSHFICHKSSIEGGGACCRGFYESSSTNMIRIAQRLGMIKEVN